MEFHGLDSDQPGDSGTGGSHWGAQSCQPCWRFWAQSLIACSRVSSLRFYRCAEGCALSSGGSPLAITSPKVTSRL